MVIRDEVSQAREAKALAIEEYADQVNRFTRQQLERGVVTLGDPLITPLHQMGQIMMPDQLERIVAAMSPRIITGIHPLNAARKCIWAVRPDGSREFISAYENGAMPEYSIFTAKYEWTPDLDYLGSTSGTPRVVQREDAVGAPVSLQAAHELITRHGIGGALAELQKRKADKDATTRPGMNRILKLGSEGIRGWRTHLVYVIQHNVATIADMERALAAEKIPSRVDNASWALGTGAQKVSTAW